MEVFFSRVNVQQEAAGLQNGFGLQASLELRLESRDTYPPAKINFLKNLAFQKLKETFFPPMFFCEND